MRIEKLNENKIRVFLNLDDLKEKNIDLHTFMSNSIESQDLFMEMLNKAETDFGFKTRNYKLIIEALASSEGSFVFTITRLKPENSSKSVLPKAKRQSIKPNKLLSIYSFNSFDDFCECCNYIKTSPLSKLLPKLKNSSLIKYKDTYYLVMHNLRFSIADLKRVTYLISEFSSKSKNDELLERKLLEYGDFIFQKNAINNCLKFFSTAKNS